nr:MAG TPA: hypothetical protein [Caudoviricetes sp.]
MEINFELRLIIMLEYKYNGGIHNEFTRIRKKSNSAGCPS